MHSIKILNSNFAQIPEGVVVYNDRNKCGKFGLISDSADISQWHELLCPPGFQIGSKVMVT